MDSDERKEQHRRRLIFQRKRLRDGKLSEEDSSAMKTAAVLALGMAGLFNLLGRQSSLNVKVDDNMPQAVSADEDVPDVVMPPLHDDKKLSPADELLLSDPPSLMGPEQLERLGNLKKEGHVSRRTALNFPKSDTSIIER